MKTLMLLGAAAFQLPPIWYAFRKGYRVVTCDNRTDNPGHALADKSYNVSTRNIGRLLEIAQHEQVDGVLSYGSDISVPAMVELVAHLDLPGPSRRSIDFLCNKERFRQFMQESYIQKQAFQSFSTLGAAWRHCHKREKPYVIKPCDRSGSLAVSVVRSDKQIEMALDGAFLNSFEGKVIVEDFIEKQGPQVCGDGFVYRGKIVHIAYGDGFCDNTYDAVEPIAEFFPSSHDPEVLSRATEIIQSILHKVGYGDGAFNFDVRIDKQGTPFVIEIGPRAGGNFIPQAIAYQSGYDLTAWCVELALGHEWEGLLSSSGETSPYVASFMVRSNHMNLDEANKYQLQETAYSSVYDKYVANMLLGFEERTTMNRVMQSLIAQSSE